MFQCTAMQCVFLQSVSVSTVLLLLCILDVNPADISSVSHPRQRTSRSVRYSGNNANVGGSSSPSDDVTTNQTNSLAALYDFLTSRPLVDTGFPPVEITFGSVGNPFSAVDLRFQLGSILAVDEVLGSVSISSTITVDWRDQSMEWNPDNFGGVTKIQFSHKDMWKPSIAMPASLDGSPVLELPNDVMIDVTKKRNVQLVTPVQFSVTCSFDLSSYPFDQQTCPVSFSEVYGVALTTSHVDNLINR